MEAGVQQVLTTSMGASNCSHIIQGTPVFWETAILAAHKAYLLPPSPYAAS